MWKRNTSTYLKEIKLLKWLNWSVHPQLLGGSFKPSDQIWSSAFLHSLRVLQGKTLVLVTLNAIECEGQFSQAYY